MTIEQIAEAAVAVADEGGLAALSMASVAQRLGCTKMALYRYVQGKSELHALMLDFALSSPPADLDQAPGWRAAVTRWAGELLARYQIHPRSVDLPSGSPLLTRQQALWLDAALRALKPAGLTLPERLSVALLLSTHIASAARMRRDRRSMDADTSLPTDQVFRAAELGELGEVIAVLAEGHLHDEDGERHEFDFGVTCILDGAETIARRRPPGDAGSDDAAH